MGNVFGLNFQFLKAKEVRASLSVMRRLDVLDE